MVEPVVLVHGGAWAVPDKLVHDILQGVKQAALKGQEVSSYFSCSSPLVEYQYVSFSEYVY